MDPASVDVVLVRPRNPANVAAACRALKNMGLGSVRLVGDDPGLGRPEARNLAYGAWALVQGIELRRTGKTIHAAFTGKEKAA